MGFFWELLQVLFGKVDLEWPEAFILRDDAETEHESLQLTWDGTGFKLPEACYEVLTRLCAGRYVVTWVKDASWQKRKEERRKREITYLTTFPMYYAQEVAGMEDMGRFYGGWKEMISVCAGFDRPILAALIETEYIWTCDEQMYILEEKPPKCETLQQAQALRQKPCRFTAEYTVYDERELMFRDFSGQMRSQIIQTIQDVCREREWDLKLDLTETRESGEG